MEALGTKPTPREILAAFPPCFYRLWAKHSPTQAITDAEIAIASGIDLNRVRAIFRMPDWQSVTQGEIEKLFVACKCDLFDAKTRHRIAQYDYVCKKRNTKPFKWLRRSPKWESEFLPLIRLMQSRTKSVAA